MIVGFDGGYSAVKAVSGNKAINFPSAVGSPDKARFSLNGDDGIILLEPHNVAVGEGAVQQSRFLHRREDRNWIDSDEWLDLFLAAMTELCKGSAEVQVVTGLPVAFYADKDKVSARLMGEHKVQREGRRAQTFNVTACRVIPQPFGSLLTACLNDSGKVVNKELATGSVGIIDVGGKTTNLLSVNRLREIGTETASVPVGAWDVIRALRVVFDSDYPGLDAMKDHQVVDAIVGGNLKYYGEPLDLDSILNPILEPMSKQVANQARQLWNGAATLDGIIITGGGGRLLGPYVCREFRHASVIEDAVLANARGYYRLGRRLWNGTK
jgi:plasmid segregation protein ParM